MRQHLRRWGAAWILLGLWLSTWTVHGLSTLVTERAQSAAHGQTFSWPQFWMEFLRASAENLQSEWAQLLVQAVLVLALGRHLFRADSTASKDDIETLRGEIRALRGGALGERLWTGRGNESFGIDDAERGAPNPPYQARRAWPEKD